MRTAIKMLGFALLLPSLALGVAPLLAAHTALLDGFEPTTLAVAGTTLFDMRPAVNGEMMATTHYAVWVIAAIGQTIITVLQLAYPVRKNRFKLSIS